MQINIQAGIGRKRDVAKQIHSVIACIATNVSAIPELIGRLQPDESSVPVFDHGAWYYTRFAPGQDYAVYARRRLAAKAGAADAAEEVLLDGPALARGHEFLPLGAAVAILGRSV